MNYKFDLETDDYIAASLAANTTRSVVKSYVPHALLFSLIFWILLHTTVAASPVAATTSASMLFVGSLAYYALTWRRKFVSTLMQHYTSCRSILGAHTLELTDSGLESTGPLHRSFRAWPSITCAVASHSHIFFHTLFGIVYILPLRAAENPAKILAVLKAHNISITDTTRSRQT